MDGLTARPVDAELDARTGRRLAFDGGAAAPPDTGPTRRGGPDLPAAPAPSRAPAERAEPAPSADDDGAGRVDRSLRWAVFAAATVLWAWTTRALTREGVVVTHDGTWYLDRAASVGDGDLWFDAVTTGTTSHYPPGYPTLVALFDALPGVSATAGAVLLNLICWVALAAGLLRLVDAFERSRPALDRGQRRLVVVAAAAALCGPVVTFATAAVLSELVFYACWVWMLVLLGEGRARSSVGGFGALVGLAALVLLTRYVAIPLVLGVALVLAVQGPRSTRGLGRAVGFVALASVPFLGWVVAVGGVHQETEPGVLTARDAVWDSAMAMGAELLHVKSGREGGVTTRGMLTFGWDRGPAIGTVAVALAAAVAVVATAAFVQRRWARRRIDGTDPSIVLFVTSVVYVVPGVWSRLRNGHLFLDRYWGLAGTFLLLVAIARPGSTRFERALWWSVLAFGTWWTIHRQLWPLPLPEPGSG